MNTNPIDRSYRNLLDCLFEKGLSPKTDSVLTGFTRFFNECHWNSSELSLANSLGNSLVECLTSPNYKIKAVSTVLLKKYINNIYEIPSNCIQRLIEVLDTTVPSSASQEALTLGCVGCTKPSGIVLHQLGIRSADDRDCGPCWKCNGGFFRREHTEDIVSSLISNLNRPISKDRKRKVRWACAIALGEIGYTNPEAVLEALTPLRKILSEKDGVDAVLFALGSIGYTRPDLVEDLMPSIQRVRSSTKYHHFIWFACDIALKKIGMETKCLLDYTLRGQRELDETLAIYFERMKDYEGGLVEESIDAIKELADRFPDKVINCLNQKICTIHQNPRRGRHLIQNLAITINELSEKFPEKMQETVPLLLEHFINNVYSYRTLNHSAIALKKIFRTHPEFIPNDIIEILNQFLIDE